MHNTITETSPVYKAQASLWDRIGLGISGFCIIHCLLIPVALAVLPLWPSVMEVDTWLHPLFAFLLLPTTVMAMRLARRKQLGGRVQVAFGLGLALIFTAWLAHDMLGIVGESIVSLLGSISLIWGHWRNWKG